MRTASMALGIVGSVLAVIFAIVVIVFGYAASFFFDSFDLDEIFIKLKDKNVHIETDADVPDFVSGFVKTIIWVPAVIGIIGAALGFVGAALVKKKNVTAGVLMIVAAVPCFFTGIGFFASICFIVGGILALVPDKQAPAPAPPAEHQ